MANEQNLKPFKPGESGNPNGRPPKLVHHVLTELEKEGFEKVKDSQIADVYLFLLNLPTAKLALIANKGIYIKEVIDGKEQNVYLETDKDYPSLFRAVAKAILSGKGLEVIEKIADRTIGKPKQSVDMTTGGDKLTLLPALQSATIDQLKDIIKESDNPGSTD